MSHTWSESEKAINLANLPDRGLCDYVKSGRVLNRQELRLAYSVRREVAYLQVSAERNVETLNTCPGNENLQKQFRDKAVKYGEMLVIIDTAIEKAERIHGKLNLKKP